ncbi:MAG TPA: histidine phosphatase family protein [Stellaceae bacterium]|nr:histidine phosphatase family protein [Stellaceae bacterium]
MHRLHLLRHAKAGRDAAVEDRDRPLSKRGRDDAHRLAARLPAALDTVDLVLCSPARRTRDTADLALAGFAPRPPIVFDEALYLAGAPVLMRRLRQLDEAEGAVLVIGHNPGLHELALLLADPASPRHAALAAGKFPTLACASFAIEGDWAALDHGRHALTGYATPKSARS